MKKSSMLCTIRNQAKAPVHTCMQCAKKFRKNTSNSQSQQTNYTNPLTTNHKECLTTERNKKRQLHISKKK